MSRARDIAHHRAPVALNPPRRRPSPAPVIPDAPPTPSICSLCRAARERGEFRQDRGSLVCASGCPKDPITAYYTDRAESGQSALEARP